MVLLWDLPLWSWSSDGVGLGFSGTFCLWNEKEELKGRRESKLGHAKREEGRESFTHLLDSDVELEFASVLVVSDGTPVTSTHDAENKEGERESVQLSQ